MDNGKPKRGFHVRKRSKYALPEDEWPEGEPKFDSGPVGRRAKSEYPKEQKRNRENADRIRKAAKRRITESNTKQINSRRSRSDQARGPRYEEHRSIDANGLPELRGRLADVERENKEVNPIKKAAQRKLRLR